MPFYAIMIYWNENFETEENHILNISNDNTKNYKLRYNSKMCKSFNIIITNTFANHYYKSHVKTASGYDFEYCTNGVLKLLLLFERSSTTIPRNYTIVYVMSSE